MKELDEIHQKLLKRLGEAAVEFRTACLAVNDPFRPVEGGWNVHQLAVHTRDMDQLVYGDRVRRTLQEDNPTFANFGGDAYMAQHYDPGEPLPGVLDGLVTSIESLVSVLREMPPDGWSRESSHETQGGGLTVQTWVERGLHHIEEHIATVKKA
ncbi:MAG TPA: DinB family protein [Anaerolineales bacterium]